MRQLSDLAEKFVVVYSSNTEEQEMGVAPHVRHRKFTEWVASNRPQFTLIRTVPNRYPFEEGVRSRSFADFYIFERTVGSTP